MTKVLDSPTTRNTPIRHYAILALGATDQCGIATLVSGGYSFQAEGETTRRLVSYKDGSLMLLGLVSLADAQREKDEAAGLVVLAAGRSY